MVRGLFLLLLLLWPRWSMAAPDVAGLYYQQRLGALLPLDAAFRDEGDRAVTLGQVTGGVPTVIVLGYFHCPALCGIVRADLMQALAGAGLATPAAYRLVAISIDPSELPRDAAAAKGDDLVRFPTSGAATGWHFLTGSTASIDLVAAAIGFHDRYDASLKQFIHPSGVVFATPSGRVSSYLLGLGYGAADVRINVARARSGGFARAVLPVLLLCFHLDPITGRYSVAILRMLQVVSALFLATVATVFAVRRGR